MDLQKQIELNYNSAAALKAFLLKEGLGMRKKYGQNFLINPGIRKDLVQALDAKPAQEVWEIGPGLGAMTVLLLEKGFSVRAFEIDAGFIRILKRIFADEKKFCLVEGDVMKTWPSQKAASWFLGNLPYNIAAVLLADLIEKGCFFTRMALTVQREVARRMCAAAGSSDYSSISVLCSSVYNVKPLMLIRGGSFYPRPNVDSMGVLLEKKETDFSPPMIFFPLVRALFGSRRKTIKNNLVNFAASRLAGSLSKDSIQDVCAHALSSCGLNGSERAETLEPEVFFILANSLENVRIFK